MSAWLLARPSDPASRAAELLLTRRSLTIPIDIGALATEYADLERLVWTQQCDAITVGLGEARPAMFIKAGLPRRRERFTVAHELGHVVLGWHIGDVACHPSPAISQPEVAGDLGERFRAFMTFRDLEKEATTFAGALLLPRSHLERAAAGEDMSDLLAALDAADMSAHAAVMTLRRHLAPGFLFHVAEAGWIDSPSTRTPPRNDEGGVDTDKLRRTAYDRGRVRLSGRTVRWYQLVEFADLPENPGVRPSREILADLLAPLGLSDAARAASARSIQGSAAGVLSNITRRTPDQAYAMLREKLRVRADLQDADPVLIDKFLAAKVHERYERLG